jgi:hypothetical protein
MKDAFGVALCALGAVHIDASDPKASPEALLTTPVDNYRRWVNFPWEMVEPDGQNRAGDWTQTKQERLRSLISRAHQLGYWIRFYTLDGGLAEQFQRMGWFSGYNFGSSDAAAKRWTAAADEGADFIASDHYEELNRMIAAESKHRFGEQNLAKPEAALHFQ